MYLPSFWELQLKKLLKYHESIDKVIRSSNTAKNRKIKLLFNCFRSFWALISSCPSPGWQIHSLSCLAVSYALILWQQVHSSQSVMASCETTGNLVVSAILSLKVGSILQLVWEPQQVQRAQGCSIKLFWSFRSHYEDPQVNNYNNVNNKVIIPIVFGS